ncbi:MAG: prolyl oligopeptidase family serine peptidase [Alphaproteobacteria bacterium]|nr:prolyl oligopeptidase family serine peptidase [Alphaproteobacteria bacterium]
MITENFILKNASGLELEARIERDETRAKQPLVFIASNLSSEMDSSISQREFKSIFIKHGLAVMQMNFRGVGESDGDVRHTTTTAGLEDLRAATDYIKTLPWVEYVGLIGSLFGGDLVFHEVAERPALDYKFLILQSARIDTAARYERDNSIDFEAWKQNGYIVSVCNTHHYSMYTDALNYKPWKVARNIKIPTLIMYGEFDTICPREIAEKAHKSIPNSTLVMMSKLDHKYDVQVGEALDKWLGELK